MIIINKNEGTKIGYEQSNYNVTFDDQLMVNCKKYQKDWPVHIDITEDRDGNLMTGTGSGLFYVAQLDIPEKQYEPQEEPESGTMGSGTPPKEIPLDMNNVTLTLWALENQVESTSEEEEA